ncbi:Flp pilus assembly protein CpaB [Gymnodinialimonas ceratoperidinii]|uniref:Flp pilus assembly protein CpaB n=1 Tax=Gymnodinialimonas ceratoperidinii TaxID=2856823 RepID=A0A8F6YAR5_9RHOB|nr:Flp pilus assembly protein CpaB [Gymnodinialimonas ceratoperidinii]QXT39306.1 Flp pilus assembly protein CpaB [Gymnodinialimonas ceratoperidinii]
MRIVFILVLAVGVGLAGFAVSIAKDRFDQYQTALAEQRNAIIPTVDVVVVNRQLRYGERLTPQDVQVIRWPADHVPFGSFNSMEDLFPEDEEGARTVIRMMEQHEPILLAKVTAPGEDAGVASRLETGMRAIALRVDVSSGVSGFLRPGDRVDVYWTGPGRGGETVTRLIRANVQLIAIDQIADEQRNSPTIARTITVTARPEDVAALTQAQGSGSLTLALVGVNDMTEQGEVEVSTSSLLGEVEEVASEGPRVCTVRNRRGAEVVITQVPCVN